MWGHLHKLNTWSQGISMENTIRVYHLVVSLCYICFDIYCCYLALGPSSIWWFQRCLRIYLWLFRLCFVLNMPCTYFITFQVTGLSCSYIILMSLKTLLCCECHDNIWQYFCQLICPITHNKNYNTKPPVIISWWTCHCSDCVSHLCVG